MKVKRIGIVSLLVASALLVSGCGKIPTLSNGDEAVVSFKDNNLISANDLYNELKEDYALKSLINMIDTYVFETEFKDKISDAKTYAKASIDSMREQYGDDSQLLQAIQYYTGYSTIEAYENYIYLNYLQEEAAKEYAKTKISDKEIEKYYKNNAVGDIEVSHILITSDVKDGDEEDEIAKKEDKAKETANEVINKLNEAKKEGKDINGVFNKLAQEYSKDDSTKSNGGSLGRINKDTLGSQYDELVDAAYKLKDGEYSTEIITTELGYHIILRTKTYDKASLEDSKEKIKDKLAEAYIESNPEVAVEALTYYRDKYDMKITDDKLAKQYKNYMQNLMSQASNSSNQK